MSDDDALKIKKIKKSNTQLWFKTLEFNALLSEAIEAYLIFSSPPKGLPMIVLTY